MGELTIPDVYRFGPAMSALPEKQRRFVLAYNNAGGGNATEAGRVAGYAEGEGLRVQAHRLLHNPAVQEAMREDLKARFVGDIAFARDVIKDIAQNPGHKDRHKAAVTLLHHGGLVERTQVEHTGTVTLTVDQKAEQVRQLAAQLGRNAAEFLPKELITDADYAENPPTSAGLEDLL